MNLLNWPAVVILALLLVCVGIWVFWDEDNTEEKERKREQARYSPLSSKWKFIITANIVATSILLGFGVYNLGSYLYGQYQISIQSSRDNSLSVFTDCLIGSEYPHYVIDNMGVFTFDTVENTTTLTDIAKTCFSQYLVNN